MEWPGQEENQSYQHFLHLSQEIRPPHSEQKQSVGGLAVTWNLSVSPGWIQKSTSGVVGMPFTPKACQAHLSLQAVLYSPFPVLPGTPSPARAPHCGPLDPVIYSISPVSLGPQPGGTHGVLQHSGP